MKATRLLCEYFSNPLGIETLNPRLSWRLESNVKGARQTAYQIICSTGKKIVWDSGKVNSSQSLHIDYNGTPLISGQRVEWKVRVWDQRKRATAFSATAFWEMGLLNATDWKAKWIGSTVVGGPRTTAPAPYLRKSFSVSKQIARARLYITALGLYEASINGQLVTDDVFAPGWPDYRKRTLYQTYDVTQLIKQGKNAIGAILGDGWYCGYVGNYPRQFFGDRPRLFSQLALTFDDGSSETIATDETWKTSTGPILESDIMMGEGYDARLEIEGWDSANFKDAGWNNAVVFPDPKIRIEGKQGESIRRIQEIKPISDPKKGIFDLGQNMTGRIRLKVKGPAGKTVTIRYAEILKPDGSLYTENLRAARCTDYYTLSGNGVETYEPKFTFHGFRYVEVKNYPGKLDRSAVTGIVIHSDMPKTGSFSCSDPLINQLQHNILWGQKGNFLDIPTDCPQRDERLGWTGDAQVFIRTAAFNMNVAPFFTKWLTDATHSQAANGGIPSVIPTLNTDDSDGGPAWSDAFIICPWTVLMCYGDTRLIEKLYPPMKRYFDSLLKPSRKGIRANPSWTPNWDGYGDWLAQDGSGKEIGGSPKDLLGTAFFAYDAKLLSEMSEAIGLEDDAKRYRRILETIKKGFNRRFVTRDGLIIGQTQTAYVLALHFDLLPESLRPQVVDALVKDIRKRGNHLSTGFVGTPYLLHVLSRFGKLDVAYDLLAQKSWPSWLYSVTKGATTIWERWDGWTEDKGFQNPGMNSFNHYAYGAVGDWLYSVVAGIDIDRSRPGYKHIIFRAQPGGGITSANASVDTLYGIVSSQWEIKKKRFNWTVVVPPNTTATVILPGETKGVAIGSGQHRFAKKWE